MGKDDITHIISHTHWDREWYIPFNNFRFRLVKMLDRCLELFDNEEKYNFKFFNLDGQTIVLEDYLEIKPENMDRLKKHIKNHKIGIGPWYLLNDPWLQTGEGNIRNLMLGLKICKQYETTPQNLGYVPDQFILFPQMPQLMKGFNIDNVAFCRGINDEYEKYGINTEFYWESADGSKVTVFHLRKGYGMAGFLTNEPSAALNQLLIARGPLEDLPRSTNQILMFNGSDHTDPDIGLPGAIEIWNEEDELLEDFGHVKHSTWDEYFHDFWAQKPNLKTIKGEISGHKYHFAARGVFSNRMPVKQLNFALHYLLEKYSEPFSALSWVLGNEYQKGFIWTAWKYLLQNQPHDSIWASCPDNVIHDIWTRFEWVRQIADEVLRRSTHEIIGRINQKSINQTEINDSSKIHYITVFNPTPWTRTDVVHGYISIDNSEVNHPFVMKDCFGNLVAAKFFVRDSTGEDRFLYRTFVPSQGSLPQKIMDFTFLAKDVPALGYITYSIFNETTDTSDEPIEETFVNATDDFLENDVIKVDIESNGSLTIHDKETNISYKRFNMFSDTGNRGCGYEYIPLKGDKEITTLDCICSSKLTEACPAYSEITITIPWKIPASKFEDDTSRSTDMVDYDIKTIVKLYPGNNRRIDIHTEFINAAKWHQIRVLFPTDLNVEKEFVKSAFQIYERSVDTPWDLEGSYATTGCYPQHSFMGLYDSHKKVGVSILNKGLPEYETYRDENKNIIIALTLLRSQGQWVVHLGLHPNVMTPDAQWLGQKFAADYSIVPMKSDAINQKISKISEEFISPLYSEEHWDVFRLKRYEPVENLPCIYSLLKIISGEVELSAVKKSEIDNKLITRLFNLTGTEQNVVLRIGEKVTNAEFVNLNEEVWLDEVKNQLRSIQIDCNDSQNEPWQGKFQRESSLISFNLSSHKIATLSLSIQKKD
jgi:alpha-mannosidase